jgi:hypothetical protein
LWIGPGAYPRVESAPLRLTRALSLLYTKLEKLSSVTNTLAYLDFS